MRHFEIPLRQTESARLYWELGKLGAFCTGESSPWRYDDLSTEELLVLAILQCRYDPRLMAVLVEFFISSPVLTNPLQLKESLRTAGVLPVVAVIGDYVLTSPARIEVKECFQFLMAGVHPVPTQLFYHGLYPVGGRKMQAATASPLWAFKKWGFLANDPPFLKERSLGRKVYLFDQSSRMEILKDWARDQQRFRLKDYLKRIDFSVTRQQALKDVVAASFISRRGKGSGRYYVWSG